MAFLYLLYIYYRMENIIELLIGTALPTIIGFVIGHYKRHRDNEAMYITNLNAAMESYNKLFDDLTKRYDEEIKSLTDKLELYERTIHQLEQKIKQLENGMDK